MHEPTADDAEAGPAGQAGPANAPTRSAWRPRLLGGAALLLGLALGALFLLRGHHVLLTLSPHHTPGPAERWHSDRRADHVLTVEPNVVLVSGNRIELRAGASGRQLWHSELGGTGEQPTPEVATRPIAIGRHLFIGLGPRLYLLDRETGAIRMSILNDGIVADIVGPPLIASFILETGAAQLMALEPETGLPQQMQQLATAVGRMYVADGVVVIALPNDNAVIGLDATTLGERWRDGQLTTATLFELDGQLYVESADADGGRRVQPLNSRSGQLGLASGDRVSVRESMLPEITVQPWATGHLVERRPLAARLEPWSTWLPCRPGVGAVQRGQLYLACSGPETSNYMVRLDWRSGAVERAWYGLDPVRSIQFGADLVLASTASRVVAFAADQAAASAAEATSVEGALDRILAQPIAAQLDRLIASVGDDQRVQLEALGEPALTPLLRRLPALADGAFAVAAQVLARTQSRAAAPTIAQHATALAVAGPAPAGTDLARQAQLAVLLHALGRIGGSDGLAVATVVLHDPRQPPLLRQRALRTLVQLKNADADIAVGLFVERSRPTGRDRWWRPLDHWQQPGSGRAIFALLGRHLDAPDGSHWILLRGGPLGDNGHLWLIQANADGSAGDAFGMLGQRCPNTAVHEGIIPGAIADVRWSGDQLAVHCVGANAPFAVALASVLSDRDGDGINDRAEELLHLNPLVADSDLDGISDGEDLTANGRAGEPMLERDQIVGAIVRDRFGALGSEQSSQPTLIVHAGAYNWETATTPLLTYNEEELAYACDVTGCADVPSLVVAPAPSCELPGLAACGPYQKFASQRPLDPDERVVIRRLRGGPPGDQDASVLVRKVGRFWVVEEVTAL